MPVTRLFVTNLSYEICEADLRELFLTVGRPTVINIMRDRETNLPRGFAFVTLDTLDNPIDCWREKIQGHVLKGRGIHIDFAYPKDKKPIKIGP
jgi:RNA recognition motif-containing protein